MLAQFSLRRKKNCRLEICKKEHYHLVYCRLFECAMGPSYLVYTVQKGTGNHTVSHITQTRVTQVKYKNPTAILSPLARIPPWFGYPRPLQRLFLGKS